MKDGFIMYAKVANGSLNMCKVVISKTSSMVICEVLCIYFIKPSYL